MMFSCLCYDWYVVTYFGYTGGSKKRHSFWHHNFATVHHRVMHFQNVSCKDFLLKQSAENRMTLWCTVAKLWCHKFCAVFAPPYITKIIYVTNPSPVHICHIMYSVHCVSIKNMSLIFWIVRETLVDFDNFWHATLWRNLM